MTFFSLEDLNKAIKKGLEDYNNHKLTTTGISRKKQFLEIEKPYLSALPIGAYCLKNYKRAKVQKMGFVYLSELKNYYSVPYRFIGYPVVLEYNQSTIEIYHNKERIAIHNISLRKGFYTSTPEHLSSSHKFYQEWSPDFFIQKALKIGENTTRYIEKLISQQEYPEIGYKQAMGILSLQKMYSVLRLENACKKGFEYNYCNYRTIKNILENNMDKLLDNHDPKPTVPNHENIRGAQAYY